jgi:hypothetical protein
MPPPSILDWIWDLLTGVIGELCKVLPACARLIGFAPHYSRQPTISLVGNWGRGKLSDSAE